VARWSRGEGEGPYPAGGVGYLRLARLSRMAARAPPEFARGLGRDVLGVLVNFCEKMGGMPPVVAPEGDLVFWGKPICPLTLLIRQDLHLYGQLGCWVRNLQKELGNPF
jgi:hypothetical protein